MPAFHKVRVEFNLLHRILSVATYPLTMPSIRGGILGWNIDIYSTRTDQFDWSVSRAYVINISRKILIECPVWGSLRLPNNGFIL